jgi:S-adenosylmethionine:tRNA ribosyltransferase-isomerase
VTLLAERPTTRFAAAPFAPAPAEWRGLDRDGVRLLVAGRDGTTDARFRDLPRFLSAGDLLVVNTSDVLPAQLDAVTEGYPLVVHAAQRLDDGTRVVELRTAPDAARCVLDASTGTVVHAEDVRLELLDAWPTGSSPTGQGNRWWRASVDGALDLLLARRGRPVAYGYLDRRYPLSAYRTVFADAHAPGPGRGPSGSAETASAARPFTTALVARLVSAGVRLAPVTLHTGLSSQEAGEAPGPEWYEVPAATADLVELTRAGGGRVVAVGTTVTRALESSVRDGRAVDSRGWTDRLVTPARPPAVVRGLVTGWHDPMASHLLLVEAVAGPALAQRAYDAAVAGGHLWHEFGDGALLLP